MVSKATGIIAAAGSGERLGAGGAKAFVELGGRPLVEWSLDALARAARVDAVVVAVPAGAEESVASKEAGRGGKDGGAGGLDVTVVPGGPSRSDSVAAALEAVETEIVVVHDAARPLVTADLIDAVISDLLGDEDAMGVVAATPVTDTIKQVARGLEVDRTLDRSILWAAQTPQAFRAEALREALASTELLAQATDDAMLLERIGSRVLLHEAPVENLKVTTELDLRIAEMLLAGRQA